MRMEPRRLLKVLRKVAPALGKRDELLSCFWFDGSSVNATSDIIAIQAPLWTDFACGIHGVTLMGIIEDGEEGVE